MPRTTLAGHPLHPQLIVAPAGLLPFSLVLDAMYLSTGRRSYADASYYAMVGGFLGGLAAGAAGAADYFTIPQHSAMKKSADIHATANLGLLALTGLNLLLRRNRQRSPGLFTFALSLISNVGLLASAWYGGHMVYTHGMRVQAAGSPKQAPEIKPPGDAQLEAAMLSLAQ